MLGERAALFWLHDFALSGVNHSIPGNGGLDCINYLPPWQKLLETAVFVPLAIYGIVSTWSHLEYPRRMPLERKMSVDERTLLAQKLPLEKVDRVLERVHLRPPPDRVRENVFMLYSSVFFIEFFYKAFTRTGIFFLNPCHITTSLQLLLLKMPADNPWTTQLFRFSTYTMPGALIALAFPILNTRLMHGEVLVYFLQHILIVLVPLYLISLGGGFVPESPTNVAWPIFSMSVILLYHFVVLQPISWVTHVNLNCILCPGVSDPFAGRFYRLCAIGHQFLVVPLVTKLYAYSSFYVVSVVELCTQVPNKLE